MQNILLAAGLAQRSGGEKLLLPYKGTTVIAHAVEQSLLAGLYTIVVTGFRAPEIEEELKALSCPNLLITHNEAYHLGQGSSTLRGARSLSEGSDFFISLADMPLIEARHYYYLAQNFTQGMLALRPQYGSEIGHPVLLRASMREKILSQKPPFRMQTLLKDYTVARCSVADIAYISDIDTIEAYDELLQTRE